MLAVCRLHGYVQDLGTNVKAIKLVWTMRWNYLHGKTCPTHRFTKSNNRADIWLLQLFKIASRKSMRVPTDLITNLYKSRGSMAIVVLINKLTKIFHLIGCCKEVIAVEYAHGICPNLC